MNVRLSCCAHTAVMRAGASTDPAARGQSPDSPLGLPDTQQGGAGTSSSRYRCRWESRLPDPALQGGREGESRPPRALLGERVGLAGGGQFHQSRPVRPGGPSPGPLPGRAAFGGVFCLCLLVFPGCWPLQLRVWDNNTKGRPGDPYSARVLAGLPSSHLQSPLRLLSVWCQGCHLYRGEEEDTAPSPSTRLPSACF